MSLWLDHLVKLKGGTPRVSMDEGDSITRIVRLLDGNARSEYDDMADVLAADDTFEKKEHNFDDEGHVVCLQGRVATTPEHLALHLPKIVGCGGCDWGKHARKPKRSRKEVFFAVAGPDAVEEPFGALVHLDWLEMRRF